MDPVHFYRDIDGHRSLRPICEVTVIGPKHHATVRAIVDSGADHCFFPISAAIDAGLDLERARSYPAVFVGSATMEKILETTIVVRGHRIRVDVVFIDDRKLTGLGALLGRSGVFATFREVVFLEQTSPKRVELRY